ncbi:MAG: PLD nuclease N-terminal domain-containing protein [Anaerolineales bacterium]|nr:PLD nuclease N-terminal domain-containing protein [Anaerolineales bacterium]
MENIREYIPLLVPVIIIQLALMIAALADLIRRPRTKSAKWLWAVVIVLVNFIGPIVYFVAGREEEIEE